MRYLPLDADDRAAMLARIGAPDIDALFADVPGGSGSTGPVDLPPTPGEIEVERALARWPRATSRRDRGRSSAAPAPIATMCRPASTTSSSARNS